MLQHHAAGAEADLRGSGQKVSDQNFRRRAREVRHVVVLCDPEAMVAKFFGPDSQARGGTERIGGIEPLFNGALVEEAKEIRHAVSSMFALNADHRSHSL